MIAMVAFVGQLFTHRFLPENRPGLAVEANNIEAHDLRRFLRTHTAAAATAWTTPLAFAFRLQQTGSRTAGLGFGRRRLNFLSGGHRALQKDLILPNDGCGRAPAGNL